MVCSLCPLARLCLSFVDRIILSLLVTPIKVDLSTTDAQMGLLMGFAFAIFYTVAGIPIVNIQM